MASLAGDLIRLLAREAIGSGGNILTHAITAPMLAKQQLRRNEDLENYKMLMNTAALSNKPEELQAVDTAMRRMGGPGLARIGGSTIEPQKGPFGGSVLPRLVGKLTGGPVAQPDAAPAQFVKPEKSLDQMLAGAVKARPEMLEPILGVKMGIQPKAGEVLRADAADKRLGLEKDKLAETTEYHKGVMDLKRMSAETQQMLVALHAQTALATAQYRKQMLDLMGNKITNVAEQNALEQVRKASDEYIKVLTIGGKNEAKVAAADAYNSARQRAIEKYPHLADSMSPEIPIEETSVEHWFSSPTIERKIGKPKPPSETAEAAEKPKVKAKTIPQPNKPVRTISKGGKTYNVYLQDGKEVVDVDNPVK